MKSLERQGFNALVACHNIVKAMEKRLGRGGVWRVQMLQSISDAPNDHIAQHARRIFSPGAAMGPIYERFLDLLDRGLVEQHRPNLALQGSIYYRLTHKGGDYLTQAISSMPAVLAMAEYRALVGDKKPSKKEVDTNARHTCSN